MIAPADVEALAEHRDPPTASPLYHNNMIFDRSFINTLVQRTGFECDGTSELHELSRRHVKLLNMTEYFPCEKGGGTYLDYELRELMTLLRPSTEVVTGEDGRRYKVKATTLHLEVRPSKFCFTTQMLLVKVQDDDDRAVYNPAVLVCKQNDSNHIQADLQLGDTVLERSRGSASDRSLATPMIAEDQEKSSHRFEVYYMSGKKYTTKHFNKFEQKVARCHLKTEYYMVGRDGRLTYELCDAHRGYPMVMVHDSSSPAVPIGREQFCQDSYVAGPPSLHDSYSSPNRGHHSSHYSNRSLVHSNLNRPSSHDPQSQGHYASPQRRQIYQHYSPQRHDLDHSPASQYHTPQRGQTTDSDIYYSSQDQYRSPPRLNQPRHSSHRNHSNMLETPDIDNNRQLSISGQDRLDSERRALAAERERHGEGRHGLMDSETWSDRSRMENEVIENVKYRLRMIDNAGGQDSPLCLGTARSEHDRRGNPPPTAPPPPPPRRSVRGGHSGGNVRPASRSPARQNDHRGQPSHDVDLAANALATLSFGQPPPSRARRNGPPPPSRARQNNDIPREIETTDSVMAWPDYATENDDFEDCRSSALGSKDEQDGPTAVRGNRGQTGGQGPIVSGGSSSRGV